MTHLNRIRARCVELLEIAKKRTPGEWNGVESEGDYFGDTLIGLGATYEGWQDDVAFVTSCAGAAEAGWRATIAAIDDSVWQPAPEGCCHPDNPWGVENTALIQQIIASWPLELL